MVFYYFSQESTIVTVDDLLHQIHQAGIEVAHYDYVVLIKPGTSSVLAKNLAQALELPVMTSCGQRSFGLLENGAFYNNVYTYALCFPPSYNVDSALTFYGRYRIALQQTTAQGCIQWDRVRLDLVLGNGSLSAQLHMPIFKERNFTCLQERQC